MIIGMRHIFSLLCLLLLCTCMSACSPATKEETTMDINSPGYWKTELTKSNGEKVTKSMLIDPQAESSDPSKPAFIAPPHDAEPFYGHPLIPETAMDGFTMGAITDFLEKDSDQGCTIGDAFVEGPDGTRALIYWEVGEQLFFQTIEKPKGNRWGVYYFLVPKAVNSVNDFKDNFAVMLPKIEELYQQAKQP